MSEALGATKVLDSVRWLLIPLSILGAAWLIAPAENKDKLNESIKRVSADKGQLCLDYFKPNLKDPDSASVIQFRELPNNVVSVTYKAKNSFGAFVSNTHDCVFSDGRVNEVLTSTLEVKSDLDKVEEELNRVRDSLDRRSGARSGNLTSGHYDP